MSDASLDSAYNYGSGNMGQAATGPGIIRRLQHFAQSAAANNGGLDHRVIKEAGLAASSIEDRRQYGKTERLKLKQGHALSVLETAAKLGAEQMQSTGKGDLQVTFRDQTPRKATPARAATAPTPPSTKAKVVATAVKAAPKAAQAATVAAKAVMAASKTGGSNGQRSTKPAAAKAVSAKPSAAPKPRPQRSAG